MCRVIIFISFIVMYFASCHEVNVSKEVQKTIVFDLDPITPYTWFLGSWKNDMETGVYHEEWKQQNDSVYSGEAYIVLDKEIMFHEQISFERHKADWYYVVNVKAQNHDKPVSFKLTSISLDKLVFENPKHDFPTKITYSKITNDSIVAEISGMVEGIEKVEKFPMKKIK